jgi:hypothetical protein
MPVKIPAWTSTPILPTMASSQPSKLERRTGKILDFRVRGNDCWVSILVEVRLSNSSGWLM